MGTLGVSLSTCTLPGQTKSDRIKSGEMEVGLGIHGEPGKDRRQSESADEIVDKIIKEIIGGDVSKLLEKEL